MKLQFIGKKLIGKETYSFSFQSKKRVGYLPGQYFYFTLPGIAETDGRGPTRQFTLSSSPTETDLKFTTQIHDNSKFKKILDELQVSTFVDADGPHGTFYFDKKTFGEHVFIAGGLGVTPFRSMTKFAIDSNLPVKITLLYSVKDLEQAVFLDEFKKWSQNDNFSFEIFTQRIDKNAITQIDDFQEKSFWITGPTQLVTDLELMLLKLKVPQDQINFEKFTGLN